MWWPETRDVWSRFAAVLALAGLTAGCFQPLYGDHSIGGPALGRKLARRRGAPKSRPPNGTRLARVGVEVRDQLIFGLTGGATAPTPNYRLDVSLTATPAASDRRRQQRAARDPELRHRRHLHADRSQDRQAGVHRTDIFARVLQHSRPEQRFSGERGQRDAEDRAAKVIAEQHPQPPGVVLRGGDLISARAVVPAKAGTREHRSSSL